MLVSSSIGTGTTEISGAGAIPGTFKVLEKVAGAALTPAGPDEGLFGGPKRTKEVAISWLSQKFRVKNTIGRNHD